ncbi:hypothetical protein EDB89DRAFT_1915717 [Lactarius sanguifluus]|nr:hypothetical protein EDB89DRAFT_1915717 [Lactarius sanguifluus]
MWLCNYSLTHFNNLNDFSKAGHFAAIALCVSDCLKVAEDRDVLQCIRTSGKLLSWTHPNGQSGLLHVFTVIARLLQDQDELGGLVIGDLIIHLFQCAVESVLPDLLELLQAMLVRMRTVQTAMFLQSLVVPFAYPVYRHRDAALDQLEAMHLGQWYGIGIMITKPGAFVIAITFYDMPSKFNMYLACSWSVCSHLATPIYTDVSMDLCDDRVYTLPTKMTRRILDDGSGDVRVNRRLRRNPAPTTKLLDPNNTERAGLPFQQKYISDYRATHGAQDMPTTSATLSETSDATLDTTSCTALPTATQLRDNSSRSSLEPGPSDRVMDKRPISAVDSSDDNNSAPDSRAKSTSHPPKKKAKNTTTLGNPDAVDADGFLEDINVQSIDEDDGLGGADRTQDVKEFFHPTFAKDVTGKGGKVKKKLYRKCKICPVNTETGARKSDLSPNSLEMLPHES